MKWQENRVDWRGAYWIRETNRAWELLITKTLRSIAEGELALEHGDHKWSEVKWSESRLAMSDSLQPYGRPWTSLGQNNGVGSLSLLQGITRGRTSSLRHFSFLDFSPVLKLLCLFSILDSQTFRIRGVFWIHCTQPLQFISRKMVFPGGGSDGKEPACHAGDLVSIPGLGRFPGEGYGNPFQYSCLENSMDRGAWPAIVHGATRSQTQLSD